MAGDLDAAIAASVRAATADLADRGDGSADPLALRGALARALGGCTGRMTMVIEEDTTRLRGWPEPVHDVDVGVRGRVAGRQLAVVSCAWWEAPGERLRTIRDACLLAAAARTSGLDAYLVVAARLADWEWDDPAAALLSDGERATVPLLRDTGVEALAAGPGTALVPARLHSTAVGSARIAPAAEESGRWEVRAARIAPAGADVALPSG